MTKASKNKILLVDDDTELLQEVRLHLKKLGYEVETATNGRTALKLVKSMELDLVVLDINFPENMINSTRSIDGIEVLRSLRDSSNIPILMLSSTNISTVKIMSLTMGADDYVSKPFDLQELGARIGAILRRSKDILQEGKILSFRRLRLDPGERRVWKDGVPIELTGIEFDILYMLARRPEHVFARDTILEQAWKNPSYSIPKVVDVHIGHIRKKIEDDLSHPAFIVAVRGTGYRFEDTPV